MVQRLDISNTDFGYLVSVAATPGIVSALFGGLALDKLGFNTLALITGAITAIGHILVAVGVHLTSYPLLLAARMIYGFGFSSYLSTLCQTPSFSSCYAPSLLRLRQRSVSFAMTSYRLIRFYFSF